MKKRPFVLRLDPIVLTAVEKWAADEFRSVNGQMEWIIANALRQAGRQSSKHPPPEGTNEKEIE